MLHMVLQKIKNQKWLNLCLFTGILLITAMFSCHPMLEQGAGSGILRRGFRDYVKENKKYPAILQRSGILKEYKKEISALEKGLDQYKDQWQKYIDTGLAGSQRSLTLSGGKADGSLCGKNYYLKFTYLKELEEHTEVVKGDGFQKRPRGEYTCIISESVMDALGLTVGEKLNFPSLTNEKNESLCMTVAGICKEKDITEPYWEQPLSVFERSVFLSEETFGEILKTYEFDGMEFTDTVMLDYSKINSSNADLYESYVLQFEKLDAACSSNLPQQFKDYHVKQKKVRLILTVLEIPCVVLLYLFLYMVSSRLLGTWEGEIAVLRSRGASVLQTLFLYFLYAFVLSAAAFVPGIFAGYFLCKFGAGCDGFLKFTQKSLGFYRFCPQMVVYATAAALSVILFLTVPVVKLAKQTIVQKKKAGRKKPLWFLGAFDIVLLGISGYLGYGFARQKEITAFDIIAGKQPDPMLLLNVTLFVFACSLFFLRAGYGVVSLCFYCMKKRGKADSYAAFLWMKRTWFSYGLLGIFLVMTVAGGITNSAMARTIGENMENRVTCDNGADMRCQEKWNFRTSVDANGEITGWAYTEPDFGRFLEISEGIKATRVLTDQNVQVKGNKKSAQNVFFMGIHTKEFGKTAILPGEGSKHHWFHDLNAMAKKPDGVIISSNLAKKLGVSKGDSISCTRYSPVKAEEEMGIMHGKVCAVVSEFPGFVQYRYGTDEKGETVEEEQYLFVCNYTQAVTKFPLTPYEVWLHFSSPEDAGMVCRWEKDLGITMEKAVLADQIAQSKNEPIVQVTNGLFTLDFLISLIVCAMGYLIYWLISVNSRQLLFGIYRAMGMQLAGIKKMLGIEQVFSSALFAAAAMGTGGIAAYFFVPLTALVYLPQKHSLQFVTQVYASDFGKIYAMVILLGILCVFILFQRVRHMRIAQTLRLGDDM